MEVKYGPYSSSRLDTAACPYRFKKQYIDKELKDFGSGASRRGNVIHEVFEKITHGWITDKPLAWDDVEKILTNKLIEYRITERVDKVLCIASVKAYMLNPPEMLEHIFGIEENLGAKWVDNKWVECDFSDPDAIYRGKIDILAIDGDTARIIDHKTQPYVEKAANTFQMGGYAWLIKLHYPHLKTIESMLHYCRADLNFYSRPYVWTQDDLGNIESEIRMEINVAENLTSFKPVSNYYCQYCPAQLDCPLLPELKAHATKLGDVKKGPIMSAIEAKTTAEELNVAEHAVSHVKKHLQNFVKAVGPVQIHGKEYAFQPSDTYEVKESGKKKELMELLGSYGLDPYAFMKVDITSLKKGWKHLDVGKLEEIKQLLTPVKKTSFRGKKV